MSMYNPPHPGEFIKATYLEPFSISQNEMADRLGVARSTFSRLIRGEHRVSSEMAIRLARVLGRSPESWLSLQAQYDLFHAKKVVNLRKLFPFDFEERKAS